MPSSPLSPSAHVASLHIGGPESLGLAGAAQWFDEPWTTAIFKRPIAGPVDVGPLGLAGDGHADLVNHGGLDKAICVYPVAHYPAWQAALGRADFTDGAFGENVSVAGLTEGDVCIGDIFRIGTEPEGLRVQVSQPRQPCWKLARKWQVKDLTAQAVANGHTGWYFRVLRPGVVRTSDALQLEERPHSAWTVAAANLVMHHGVGNTRALASLDALSASWKRTLSGRASP